MSRAAAAAECLRRSRSPQSGRACPCGHCRAAQRHRELSSADGNNVFRQGPEASAHSWDAGSLPLPSQSPLREHDGEDAR
eukprot:SM000213S06835  [mRNA]  locus=s213:237357:237936:+ [translate_table: standard]